MANIIFSEASGVNGSVFGEAQAPIRMMIETYGEQWEKMSLLDKMFKMGTSENAADLMTEMTAMGGFDPVGENGDYPTDGTQVGEEKIIRYETWKNSFAVSQEMMEDNKLIELGDKPKQLVASWYRTREEFGAALYGGGISGSDTVKFRGKSWDITGADGKNIFHTGHKALLSGKVQSNKFSNAFSVDALDRAEAAMQQMEGHNGEILGIQPDTIMIANDPVLKRAVFAAIGADKDPDTEKNGFNWQFGRWNVMINPYLNKFIGKESAPWILLDDAWNQLFGGAVWNDRIPLTFKSEIDNNDANRWKARGRFSAVFKSFQFACVGGITGGTDLTTLKI